MKTFIFYRAKDPKGSGWYYTIWPAYGPLLSEGGPFPDNGTAETASMKDPTWQNKAAQ
jgi:hypothetical protein